MGYTFWTNKWENNHFQQECHAFGPSYHRPSLLVQTIQFWGFTECLHVSEVFWPNCEHEDTPYQVDCSPVVNLRELDKRGFKTTWKPKSKSSVAPPSERIPLGHEVHTSPYSLVGQTIWSEASGKMHWVKPLLQPGQTVSIKPVDEARERIGNRWFGGEEWKGCQKSGVLYATFQSPFFFHVHCFYPSP